MSLLLALHMLGLSSLTSNLDDIKHLTLWIGGASCLAIWFALAAFRVVGTPTRVVGALWTATLATAVVSAAFGAAPYAKWIAWQGVRTQLCTLGWFLLSFAMASRARTARAAMAVWVGTALASILFGLFHYAGGMEPIRAAMDRAYAARRAVDPNATYGGLYTLVLTFAESREMLSTALNTQFYGVFLSFAMPVGFAATLLGLRQRREGGGKGALVLAAAGALVALLAPACILLTYSKLTLFLVPLGIAAFAVVLHARLGVRILRVPMWPVALAFAAVVVATALWFGRADIRTRFSAFATSVSSRTILAQAAVGILRDHPAIGVGPRAYMIEAPNFRSPDYHMNAISNIAESSHNWVLDQLAETGIVGTLPWLGLNLFVLARAWMGAGRREADPVLRYASAGFGVGLLLFLCGNLLTSMSRWPLGLVQHAVALGLTAGAAEAALRSGPAAEASKTVRAMCGTLFVASLAFFAYQAPFAVGYLRAANANQKGLAAGFMSAEIESMKTPRAFEWREKQLLEAKAHFERAVAFEPTYLTSRYKLAHTLNRLGALYRERYAVLLADETKSPDREARLRDLLMKSLEYNKATFDAYDGLGERFPDYAEIHYNRVVLHFSVGGDCLRATEDLELSAEDREFFVDEARRHFALGAKSAERACALSNKITVHTMAADLHALAASTWPADSTEAAAENEIAGECYLRASALPLTTAVQYAGQTEVERDELLRAARRAPEMFFRAKNYDRAGDLFEGLVARWPGDNDLYKRAVECRVRGNRTADALRLLDEGLARNPLSADLMLLKAEVLLHDAETPEESRAALLEAMTVEEMSKRVDGFLTAAQRKQLDELLTLSEAGLAPQ